MNLRAKIMVGLALAVLAVSSAFAGDNKVLVIKGKVMDDDGKPADGTEVRVRALDRKAPDKIVETDSRGQYIVLGLIPGKYSVTAYDFFGNARSRALIEAQRKGWARVNFDLALDSVVGDTANTITGHDHMTSASSHLGPLPLKR
jgi:carboxypeptidase family protein